MKGGGTEKRPPVEFPSCIGALDGLGGGAGTDGVAPDAALGRAGSAGAVEEAASLPASASGGGARNRG